MQGAMGTRKWFSMGMLVFALVSTQRADANVVCEDALAENYFIIQNLIEQYGNIIEAQNQNRNGEGILLAIRQMGPQLYKACTDLQKDHGSTVCELKLPSKSIELNFSDLVKTCEDVLQNSARFYKEVQRFMSTKEMHALYPSKEA